MQVTLMSRLIRVFVPSYYQCRDGVSLFMTCQHIEPNSYKTLALHHLSDIALSITIYVKKVTQLEAANQNSLLLIVGMMM